MSGNSSISGLVRTIGWKQGMLIALGVPILILPSIGYSAGYLYGFAVVLWGLSVLQGFLQNSAFAEMSTVFPKATGIPGCSQEVFTDRDSKAKFNKGKFIGAFCAWCYWFAWSPVVAIFTITIGTYLQSFLPGIFGGIEPVVLSLVLGAIIVSVMLFVGSKGLSGGAKTGLVLAIATLVPLVIILVAPFITGNFSFDRIVNNWLPPGWSWGGAEIAIFIGLMGIAQWSACAWETAAIYGPEYKNPKSDVPKALFSCGLICLVLFILTQTSVTGTLGIEGILAQSISPLVPLAEITFGGAASSVLLILLIGAMLLIIQTGYLGSSRTIYSMATEGNLPSFFKKVNKNGVPVLAMIFVSVFNLALIGFSYLDPTNPGNPVLVLSASSLGYAIAISIALLAFIKTRTDPNIKSLERGYKAPKFWIYVVGILLVYEVFLIIPCILYINITDYGAASAVIGAIVLLVFIPIWLYTQKHESERAIRTGDAN